MRWAVLLAVVGLAVSAPVATAAPFTPQLDLDYAVAVEYWGHAPEACATITAEVTPEEPNVAGRATEPEPGAAPRSVSCALWVGRYYANPELAEEACKLMIHEVGHLLGYSHSDDPASPMYPSLDYATPPVCRELAKRETRIYVLELRAREALAQREPRFERRMERELRAERAAYWAPLTG